MRDPVLERRYAGALMLDVSQADRAGVGLDDVTDREVRRVLECIYGLRDRGQDVNPDTLEIELERRGYQRERQLDVMAWARGLDDIAAIASRLRELSEARQIEELASQVVRVAKETGDPAKCREVMRDLFDLGRSSGPADRVQTFRQVCARTAEELAKPMSQRGMRLGWPSIDAVYRLSPGQLLVLGAQTNVGKTSACATWGLHLASTGEPTGVISVEDSAADWGAKWIGEVADVNPADLWRGKASKTAGQVGSAIVKAADTPLWFSEVSSRELDHVCADMAHMRHAHGVKAIIVDYLQAIRLPRGSKDLRTATDEILGALIGQAGRLGVGLVLACQLSRPAKGSPYREPNKHDLKESGTIENRAQCIVMLWRDEAGQVLAKIEKAKRVDFSPAPFPLVRRMQNGRLAETVKDASAFTEDDPWTS